MNGIKVMPALAGLVIMASTSFAAADVSLGDGPAKSLIAFTKCSDIKPTNIMTGYLGAYTFSKGFSTEKRSGFIKRENGTLTNNCILPSLQPHQMVYMEVDTKKFEAAGSSNDWSMQCVKSENPGGGLVNRTEAPYKVTYLSGKDLMLHCGHSEKNAKECAEGSNSSRSGKWSKQLKVSGKTMLSVLAQSSTLAAAGGEKLYCQYYNKVSGKSLFAFEYIRTRK